MRHGVPAARWRAAVSLCALSAAGCAGHASIHVVPLGSRNISATKPLVVRIEPDECYYWVNQQQQLCVAMRQAKGSLWGKRFEQEFLVSLVLDGLPAGSTRNYRVGRRTVRSRYNEGFHHTRSASLTGIAAIWDFGKRNLQGRFRLIASRQDYSVLTGWRGKRRVLLVGEFTAVPDTGAGRTILEDTEEGAMSRLPPQPKPIPVQGPPRKHQDGGN